MKNKRKRKTMKLGYLILIIIIIFLISVCVTIFSDLKRNSEMLANPSCNVLSVVKNNTNLTYLNYAFSNETDMILLSNGSTIKQCLITMNSYIAQLT